MDSLHKGGGFKTIYMRKGAIDKKLVIYIIITVVRLSVRLSVRVLVCELLFYFLLNLNAKYI